jgi:hypothetical protein
MLLRRFMPNLCMAGRGYVDFPDYCNCLRLRHAVFISGFAKITLRSNFFVPAGRLVALQCLTGQRLSFPLVWHLTCYIGKQALSSRDADA